MMKHILTYCLLAASLLVASCTKDVDDANQAKTTQEGTPTWATFTISTGTKANTPGTEPGTDDERKISKVWIVVFHNDAYETTIKADFNPALTTSTATITSPIVSGSKKRFCAIINPTETKGAVKGSQEIIDNFIKSGLSYQAFKRLVVDLGRPNRIGDQHDSNAQLYGCNANWIGVNTTDGIGLLMTGSSGIVTVIPGIPEAEAPVKNKVTIPVNRNVGKVEVLYQQATFPIPADIQAVANGNTLTPKIVNFINMPVQSYLMNENSSDHPFYDWSTIRQFQDGYSNNMATTSSNVSYLPENIVKKAYRGNTSFIAIKSEITIKQAVTSEKKESGKPYTFTPEAFSKLSPLFITFDDNLNITNYYNVTYLDNAILCHSVDLLQKVGIDFSKTTSITDCVSLVKGAIGSNGAAITANKWIAYHTSKSTDKFVDEVSICYYDDKSQEVPSKRQHFKIANYTVDGLDNCYMWSRIDIKDPSDALQPYGVKRNHYYKITLKGFKSLGYPSFKDLLLDDQNELNTQQVDVDILVTDWEDGGNQEIEI